MGEVIAWPTPRKGLQRLYHGKVLALPVAHELAFRARVFNRHDPERLQAQLNAFVARRIAKEAANR